MQKTLDNVAKERRSRFFDPGQLFFGRDLSVVRTPAGAALIRCAAPLPSAGKYLGSMFRGRPRCAFQRASSTMR